MSGRDGGELSTRDRQILGFVGDVGVASVRQIERLAFAVDEAVGGSALSAARRCRRVCERLVRAGYLNRLDRRIGGVRAGSAGFLYQLGTRGKRALELPGRGRTWQPGSRFVDHALEVAEVHVGLVVAEREGGPERLRIWHEPETWRRFSTPAGIATLKPDLLVELTTAHGWELRWFVEIDRATEHLPTVIRKCELYEQYWRSGREASVHEVFPRVLWSVPDERRLTAVEGAIRRTRALSDELFAVATAEDAVAVLTTNTINEHINEEKGGHP